MFAQVLTAVGAKLVRVDQGDAAERTKGVLLERAGAGECPQRLAAPGSVKRGCDVHDPAEQHRPQYKSEKKVPESRKEAPLAELPQPRKEEAQGRREDVTSRRRIFFANYRGNSFSNEPETASSGLPKTVTFESEIEMLRESRTHPLLHISDVNLYGTLISALIPLPSAYMKQ